MACLVTALNHSLTHTASWCWSSSLPGVDVSRMLTGVNGGVLHLGKYPRGVIQLDSFEI